MLLYGSFIHSPSWVFFGLYNFYLFRIRFYIRSFHAHFLQEFVHFRSQNYRQNGINFRSKILNFRSIPGNLFEQKISLICLFCYWRHIMQIKHVNNVLGVICCPELTASCVSAASEMELNLGTGHQEYM